MKLRIEESNKKIYLNDDSILDLKTTLNMIFETAKKSRRKSTKTNSFEFCWVFISTKMEETIQGITIITQRVNDSCWSYWRRESTRIKRRVIFSWRTKSVRICFSTNGNRWVWEIFDFFWITEHIWWSTGWDSVRIFLSWNVLQWENDKNIQRWFVL